MIRDMRPKEVREAFALAETNRPPYRGVTIGDVHRALTLISNYAGCLESHNRGLHQRLSEIRRACTGIVHITTGAHLSGKKRSVCECGRPR